MSGLRRIVSARPAFDRRHPDPSKNYGIGGVTLYWAVVGPVGAISWSIFTNWYLPHVAHEANTREGRSAPVAGGVCYHDTVRHHESQEIGDCELLPGGKCYSDCSYLAGNELLERLITEGGEAVWQELESRYVAQFGEVAP